MTRISIVIFALLIVNPAWAACGDAKLAEVRTARAKTVEIDCDLNLAAGDRISKRLVLKGRASSGVTVDCHGGTLAGGVSIRSRSYVENGVRKWEPVTNTTVRNCKVTGGIHVMGMARNAEGTVYNGTNFYKISSRLPGHTARARANAPSHITLENLVITSMGGWPVYFAPGVTYSRLVNSELTGTVKRGAIYLDAESAFNIISGNRIDTRAEPRWVLRLTNWLGFPPGIQAISIDGSSHNTISGNRISNLSNAAIHLYRNCGEGGVIRHATPSYNTITNNDFRGSRPAIHLGSRDGRGWLPIFNTYPCDLDEGHLDAGSAKSNKDHARHNIVTHNRFHSRAGLTLDDLIRSENREGHSQNFIDQNELVADETID